MAATWSIAGGVVTLTLSGGDTGPVSRSKTFSFPGEPDELVTFYLAVAPDSPPVQAFLEVVGGDEVVATASGTQTLTARGDTDGSGNITVRYGVLAAEAAGDAATADDLDAADIATLHAAGWATTDTITAGGWFPATATTSMSAAQTHGGHAASLEVEFSGYTFNYGYLFERRTFGGHTPAASVTYKVWAYATLLGSGRHGLRINGDDSLPAFATNYLAAGETGAWKELFVTGTADGSGNVVIDLGVFVVGAGSNALRTLYFSGLELVTVGVGATAIDFSALTYCLGSGLGDGGTGVGPGNGTGGPGTEPIPTAPPGGWPLPPVGGARRFGIDAIPAGGLSYWNATIKRVTPLILPNLLNEAATGSAYLYLKPYLERDTLDAAGRFSYDLWQAQFDAILDDPRAEAALDAALGDTAHWIMDEPYVRSTRYGGPVPIGTIERMCLYSKARKPTWRTVLRLDPIDQAWWMTRHINGLDDLHTEYHTRKGDVTAYREANLDRAEALGHQLILGIHYFDFHGVPSDVAITPAELRHYGGILASTSRSVGMGGWQFRSAMYNQSGFPDALKYVRDLYASFDP